MYALVEDGSITKHLSGNRGITIGDIQYPKGVFNLWTKSQREAIGIYEIVWDNSKKKDDAWYVNTNQTFAFANGKVTASYGDATAKKHADTLYTAQDEIDGKGIEGEVSARGLKYNLIQTVKQQANTLLSETDWYVTRKYEKSTAIPSNVTTWRNGIRSKQAEMETAITNASDTPALETLHTYTEQEDGSVTRPLGELPRLEV